MIVDTNGDLFFAHLNVRRTSGGYEPHEFSAIVFPTVIVFRREWEKRQVVCESCLEANIDWIGSIEDIHAHAMNHEDMAMWWEMKLRQQGRLK